MRKLTFLATALAALLGAIGFNPTAAQSYVGTTPAKEFPAGLDWINTDRPLTLAELRGKIVLLDFWTYGCINCIHVIPDLKALEAKYPDELVVIGVHSAKFLNEGDTVNIELVAERYGRTEPIVNDAGFDVWRSYNVRAWPTLMLIDPEGNVLGRHEGESAFGPLDAAIVGMIATFDARGTLDRTPLDLGPSEAAAPRTVLRFPEQVLADATGGRLFIADSGNDRIVVTDLGGVVQDVIGSGASGLVDGAFEEAAFEWPHGMALASPTELYVADTGNHAIRLVDLAERTVRTVAGTGEQVYMFNQSSVSASSGLNSPWDVLWLNGQLYVAMAGQHQVWRYDPGSDSSSAPGSDPSADPSSTAGSDPGAGAGTLYLVAGSGREELRDGAATLAGLNQPTGLATDGEALFVADSEASAVRRIDLAPDGQVSTVVGTGLFDFGDVDGVADAVRLQHAQAVDYADGFVYVADTYNNKVKRLDPATRESVTLLGTGEAGWKDGAEAEFHEPGGLSVVGQLMYVADTNNHLIRVADLGTLQVRTLALTDPNGVLVRPMVAAGSEGAAGGAGAGEGGGAATGGLATGGLATGGAGAGAAGTSQANSAAASTAERFDEVVELPAVAVTAGAGSVALTLTLPNGYQANDLAPLQVRVTSNSSVALLDEPAATSVSGPEYPLTLEFPATFTEGEATLQADVVVYYCRKVAAELCLIRQVRLVVPVSVVVVVGGTEGAAGGASASAAAGGEAAEGEAAEVAGAAAGAAEAAGASQVTIAWQPPALAGD